MRRPTPPLEARASVLRAWIHTGTPPDVARRLCGRYGRATVNDVRNWASMHGYLLPRPPRGLQLSSAGASWLAEVDAGKDPDAQRRTAYVPPSEAPQQLPRSIKRVKRGSMPHRVLCYLHRHGSDCAAEIARAIAWEPRRVRRACHMLQIHHLVKAEGREMWIHDALGPRQAVVMVYTCTDRGRAALSGAQ